MLYNKTSLLVQRLVWIVRDDPLHRGDGHLDHAVVRLLGGQALGPQARRGEDAGEQVVVSAGILDALIGERHDDGQAENLEPDAHPDIVPGDQGGHQDGEQQHDDQKAGAAARVEAGILAHILHREGVACLVAGNGLVLGPVVLEHPPARTAPAGARRSRGKS